MKKRAQFVAETAKGKRRYVTDESACAHQIRLHTFVRPEVMPTKELLVDSTGKPIQADGKAPPGYVKFQDKLYRVIRDGPQEFLLQNGPTLATIEKCISSGWEAAVLYVRRGGRQFVMEAKQV